MGTVRDVCDSVLKIGNVIDAEETASAADIDFVLTSLKQMLSQWSTQSLMVPRLVRETFTLVPSQQQYTFGPSGATFTTSRPKEIRYASVIPAGQDIEFEMDILTPQDWAGISDKTLARTIPSGIYPEGVYPNETAQIWPVPSAAATLVLYSRKSLDSDIELSDELDAPDGMEEAMIYNCAKRVLSTFGRSLTPEQMEIARTSFANVKRANFRPLLLNTDAPLLTNNYTYDIYKGS